MTIDDKIEKALDSLSEQGHGDVGAEILLATISTIPFAGSAISSLLSGRAKRRVVDRAKDVFTAMKELLEKLDEKKIDKNFFESEEFQTLLALTLEQLQTTHDKEKLRMLAAGLANSCVEEFSSDTRKEMFVRILRDLSLNHVRALQILLPRSDHYRLAGPDFWPLSPEPRGESLAALQTLAANGLVEEILKSEVKISNPRYSNEWTPTEAKRAINKALETPPSRHFRISRFGLDFLSFCGLDFTGGATK